jgi:hypothetical protein
VNGDWDDLGFPLRLSADLSVRSPLPAQREPYSTRPVPRELLDHAEQIVDLSFQCLDRRLKPGHLLKAQALELPEGTPPASVEAPG